MTGTQKGCLLVAGSLSWLSQHCQVLWVYPLLTHRRSVHGCCYVVQRRPQTLLVWGLGAHCPINCFFLLFPTVCRQYWNGGRWIIHMLEGRADVLQGFTEQPGESTEKNLMKLKKDKHRVLCLGWDTPPHGRTGWGWSKQTVVWQKRNCESLWTKCGTCPAVCLCSKGSQLHTELGEHEAKAAGREIWECIWSTLSTFGLHSTSANRIESRGGHRGGEGVGWELGLFSMEKGKLQEKGPQKSRWRAVSSVVHSGGQ